MRIKSYYVFFVFFFLFGYNLMAQVEKKVLKHEDNSKWNYIKKTIVSLDGNYISYQVDPLEGDGQLYLYNNQSEQLDSISRGASAAFSPSNLYMVFKIKPIHDSLISKKRAKVKKDKLPKDSLGIWDFVLQRVTKIPDVEGFDVPGKAGEWFAVRKAFVPPAKDTTKVEAKDTLASAAIPDSNEVEVKLKSKLGLLQVINPILRDTLQFEHIKEYQFSQEGNVIAMLLQAKDSVDQTATIVFDTKNIRVDTLFHKQGVGKKLSVDYYGDHVAFLYSGDTCDTKVYELVYFDLKKKHTPIVLNGETKGMPEGYAVSGDSEVEFSKSGKRLYLGTAPAPMEEPKDTLLPEEKVNVDIWHWKDQRLQPMQLVDKEKDLERSYIAVWLLDKKKFVQLADTCMSYVIVEVDHDEKYGLGLEGKAYQYLMQWEGNYYNDIYLVDILTGQRRKILEKFSGNYSMSPDQKFLAYYKEDEGQWYCMDLKNFKTVNLTGELDVNFYNEDHDMPSSPGSYGYMGWLEKDKGFVIYDRYDLWEFDPKGKTSPRNITGSYGRENKVRLRYNKLNKEERYVSPEKALLRAFDERTKANAFYELSKEGELKELLSGDYYFERARKAEKGKTLIYRRENFQEYPNIWVTDLNFHKQKRISNANPQQKEYNWGTVELVEWKSFGGVDLQGLLYKPENFDPQKKYPMIVYFYERYTDRLHYHHIPKPSYSTINFTQYVSNGYLVFVPDIVYTEGNPGKDAYNAIVSGVEALASKYDFVDRDHMGLQGQSWGGYQTAYLVTQTDIFAAAEAGAPVSNMTSAYGGIRWGRGLSRQFQYEKTQSRIGGTLWEKPMNYINNSPLFFADQVHTPLMIMHNDEDGAVPWYQGIELFMALKRLQKPVWLVNYNGAPHNLRRLADRKDLTIRMQQFFDHYLKGAPAPEWLEYGLPAIKKGKDNGFKLTK